MLNFPVSSDKKQDFIKQKEISKVRVEKTTILSKGKAKKAKFIQQYTLDNDGLISLTEYIKNGIKTGSSIFTYGGRKNNRVTSVISLDKKGVEVNFTYKKTVQ